MLQNLYEMYRDIKHQETLQASFATKNLKSLVLSSPLQKYQPSELNLQEVPPNLQYI